MRSDESIGIILVRVCTMIIIFLVVYYNNFGVGGKIGLSLFQARMGIIRRGEKQKPLLEAHDC